jgi:hypothetical protein
VPDRLLDELNVVGRVRVVINKHESWTVDRDINGYGNEESVGAILDIIRDVLKHSKQEGNIKSEI